MGTVDHVDLCSGRTPWHVVLTRMASVVTSLIDRLMRLMNSYSYSRLQSRRTQHPRSPTAVSECNGHARRPFTIHAAADHISTHLYAPVLNRFGSCISASTQTAPYGALQLEVMIVAAAAAMHHRLQFWGDCGSGWGLSFSTEN
jgi:hypothetical protein